MSKSIELDKKKYNKIFKSPSTKSVFVYIWDNSNLESQQFLSQWNILSDADEYRDIATYADVLCSKNLELCHQFDRKEIPRLLWYETPQSTPEIYNGRLHINSVTQYLRNITASPIIKVRKSKYSPFISKQIQENLNPDLNDGEYFLFNISTNDKDSIEIAKQIAKNMKFLPTQIFLLKDKSLHAPYLTSHKGNKTFKMMETLTYQNAEAFIIRRNIPFLTHYTQAISDISFKYKIPFAVFVRPDEFGPIIKPFAEVVENYMAVTQTNCILSPSICRYINQKPKDYGYIAFLNRSSYTFWVYDKPLDEKYIDSFVEDIVNHQLTGYGPGIWLKPFVKPVNFYYSMRERGGMPFYTIQIPLCFATILFCFIVYKRADTIVWYVDWVKAKQEEKRKRIEYYAELERQKKNRLKLKNR
ncbi:hypothetical protein TVAG_254820 [Trichomonas vaginalis G3]|uniref:Thioredoxin domain-containing protein n=1 Tax=Trichomonas vaginalis (strain ATCC PRA-98 / G3) TaxID=412133 RepID=A2EXM4_TRIV3|nr:glutaredoxin domain-containing protein [Trichomonas vaginalis G3]EAY02581.1 hypothetical protein TVAG_254820 [Trichomonas vaginalis G3]KAI5512573.1 glutaredoxin domain-containing protein [Trichomonas vaginalis G3]|eukprot:XP_001314804.1 hypothetical protein [Trichomonas vaginalis G3]